MQLTTIRQDTRYLISPQIGTDEYPDADLDRNLNTAYQTVLGWILPIQGDWEIEGDVIYRDRTAGATEFELPSRLLRIYKGEVMNANGGEFVPLKFISIQRNQSSVEGNTTRVFDDGTNPTAELYSDFIQIRPASETTVQNGIKLWVQLAFMDLTDTNDVPRLMEPVIRALALLAALDFAIAEEMDRKVSTLSNLIWGNPSKKDDLGVKGMVESLYSIRNGTRRDRLTAKKTSYR